MSTNETIKVITSDNTRLSYANVWDPKSIDGRQAKYSTTLLIPKNDPCIDEIKAAISETYEREKDRFKDSNGEIPALSDIYSPLRDGDTERPLDKAYAGHYFIKASTLYAPDIIDANMNPITTRSEIYSGVYCKASIAFYPFKAPNNQGIACSLRALQKVSDGEPLGQRSSAVNDFTNN